MKENNELEDQLDRVYENFKRKYGKKKESEDKLEK